MKIHYIIQLVASVAFLFLTNTLSAQSWITQGQIWEYFETWPLPSLLRYQYSGDTLIMGRICQKISAYSRWVQTGPGAVIVEVHDEREIDPIITFNSGDSVFVFNDTFRFQFSWQALPGDTLFEYHQLNCDPYILVDSVGTMNFGGQTLRWQTLRQGTPASGLFSTQGKVIENFGVMHNLFTRTSQYQTCDGTIYDYPIIHALCYTHPNWGTLPEEFFGPPFVSPYGSYQGPLCDYYQTLGLLAKLDQEGLSLFPQPADEVLNVKLPRGANFQAYVISDSQGRCISTGNISGNSTSVDISDLASGIYYLTLHGAHAVVKRIVVN